MDEAAEQGAAGALAVGHGGRALAARGREGGLPGLLAGVLLALVHLLDEGLGLLLVGEGQAGGALLELEGVEEGAVLVVGEALVDLLVPDDASSGRLH